MDAVPVGVFPHLPLLVPLVLEPVLYLEEDCFVTKHVWHWGSVETPGGGGSNKARGGGGVVLVLWYKTGTDRHN